MAFRYNQGDRPLDGYTIQRGVGRGGFGEVYYAVSDGGKEVALKYLRENPSVELRGVQAVLNLKSPHLISVHDVRQTVGGDWFIVMEYIAGPSLRDLMNSTPGGLGPQKAAYLIREIGKGLNYLHERGIVHRDLKPGNVFYDEGYVKIGDYGLSKFMTASQHSGQTVSVGTVHYMAPEIGSGNYDRTIDIYAMGVMLYEMVLGKVPFAGATVGEILMKHLTAQPEVDALPAPFPDVIRKALSKDPKDRYATVPDMMKALFAESQLDMSVAAFEPASLSVVAARVTAEAGFGGGVAVATGSSNVGGFNDATVRTPAPPIIGGTPRVSQAPADRFGGAVEKVHGKASKIAAKVDNTYFGRKLAAGTEGRSPPERLVIALLLLAGFSFVTGYLISDSSPTIGMCLKVAAPIAAIVQGVIVGCWLGFQRYQFQGVWLTRILIAALVGVVVITTPSPLDGFVSRRESNQVKAKRLAEQARLEAERLRVEVMGRDALPATPEPPTPPNVAKKESSKKTGPIGLVKEAGVAIRTTQPIALPLILLMLLGDWPKRYYAGRRGQISLGLAFSAWLFTLVACAITDVEPKMAVALIAGAASLALQALAGLWPLASIETIPAVLRKEMGALGREPKMKPAIATAGSPAQKFKFGREGVFAEVVFGGGRKARANNDVLESPPTHRENEAASNEASKTARRLRRRGGWLLGIGIVWICSLGAVVPVLVHVFNHTSQQWLIPAVTVPNAICGVGLIVMGGILLASAAKRQPKLELPLRRVFEVGDGGMIGSIVERHFFALGYSAMSRGEMVWSFERGSSVTVPWDTNYRKLKSNVNIAAYQIDSRRWQIHCYLDINITVPWHNPDQPKLRQFNSEFDQLRDLLAATEVSSTPHDA